MGICPKLGDSSIRSQSISDIHPAVAYLPHGHRMLFGGRRIKLNSLSFPLGRPQRLGGDTMTLHDLKSSDHLIVHPRKLIVRRRGVNISHRFIRTITGIRAQISLLAACEPLILHAHYIQSLFESHKRFYRILTRNEDLINSIPNGVFFPFGSSWISKLDELEIMKTRPCSLIASSKNSLPGHRLRHRIIRWAKDTGIEIDALGQGYQPFQPRAAGLAPYRFSVVIENTQEKHYFTEKIVDAILCKTIPIYWGCPNISDFFDVSGMIICKSEADLCHELTKISNEKYLKLLPKLCNAWSQAAHWADLEGRAARAVLDGLYPKLGDAQFRV